MSAVAHRRISDDLRYELSEAASASERSNRPRSLLAVATMLFLLAGIVLIVSLRQRDAAVREFRIQSDWKVLVAGLSEQNKAIQRVESRSDLERSRPLNDLLTRIESAATAVGLEKPSIPQQPGPVREGSALKRQYAYTMRHGSLEPLLSWIQQCQADVPGLEVSGIEIVPQAKAWQCKVTFVRWERVS